MPGSLEVWCGRVAERWIEREEREEGNLEGSAPCALSINQTMVVVDLYREGKQEADLWDGTQRSSS